MKYELEYSKELRKFLTKHSDISGRILEKLETLALNPYENSLDIKPLKDSPNHYRLRVGKYRILYEIIDECILIYAYRADSRGDVYK
ncbi:type II toxin-antitoxin system mRNA interferase toxin, RelE/StbE family [Helicobacter didelphidarum]|uniref:Type II toxin-antitoxin system mRNA interferase toxin, RelE/StbE family n=1 Tax=Helicobacter didelphidarum TaxID=2040648 RepID=A0A3D8IJG7_9HELI|nr:type II toxin-antitoxin system RelE/ParE family toxin [Helicobacter didelphidarum]RDU65283.1 type II toxin-antitoxin system mRNA interferase toxin, RelE/StbE family [Helicobacter didelphidarum]